MSKIPVIAVFDVGKTNKKLLLFDENYDVVTERVVTLKETADEDGFACEDVALLNDWITDSLHEAFGRTDTEIRAINFSGYGATFVLTNQKGLAIPPIYNYLKPFPTGLKSGFYARHGGEDKLAIEVASPVLGNLNSGMQLVRLKQENPQKFDLVRYALHLPQYLSHFLTGVPVSEITSIGCHTNLWDYRAGQYHEWVSKEKIAPRLAPIVPSNTVAGYYRGVPVGPGLHDSSSALVPYLKAFRNFVLLSTGTWSISLNPFNNTPLTKEQLAQDCLCYLTPDARQVKSSRLFAGHDHEQQAGRLAEFFQLPSDFYNAVKFNDKYVPATALARLDFSRYESPDEAYHNMVFALVERQVKSTRLVLTPDTTSVIVDGGFGKNEVFMNLLARAMPDVQVYAAVVPQASAIGAAMIFHKHWNKRPLTSAVIGLTLYSKP